MDPIFLDLTPWVRGPFSGVGLSARRSYDALIDQKAPVSGVQRGWSLNHAYREIGPVLLGERRRKESVFHSFDGSFPWGLRGKRVLTLHDLWSLEPNPYQPASYQKSKSQKLHRALSLADWVITPTEFVRQHLIDRFPKFHDRSTTIPWGPLLSPSSQPQSLRPTIVSWLADENPFVVSIACLETRKNYAQLCAALENLPNIRLAVVGSRGFQSEDAEHRIHHLGNRAQIWNDLNDAELSTLIQEAEAQVLISLDEGFGMPAVEAMALGSPTILSNIPTLREVAGDAGLYIELGDVQALSQALHQLCHDKTFRQTQSQKSLQRAKAFSWDRVANETLKVYRATSQL